MNLKIDKRTSKAIYVDSAKLHKANNNTIINMINTDNDNPYLLVASLICFNKNMYKDAPTVLYLILRNRGKIDLGKLYKDFNKLTTKSRSTCYRCLKQLKDNNILDYTEHQGTIAGDIKLNSDYLPLLTTGIAQFLVIEINTNKTSPKINLL